MLMRNLGGVEGCLRDEEDMRNEFMNNVVTGR